MAKTLQRAWKRANCQRGVPRAFVSVLGQSRAKITSPRGLITLFLLNTVTYSDRSGTRSRTPLRSRTGLRAGHWSTAGREKLLQNSLNDQDRSTNTLTLGPSPRGRGNCKIALDLLLLPLGEGWGEGNRIQLGLNRGTI